MSTMKPKKWTSEELDILRKYYPTKSAGWIKQNHLPHRGIPAIRKKANLIGVQAWENAGQYRKGQKPFYNKNNPPPKHVMQAAWEGMRNKPKKPYPREYYRKTMDMWIVELKDGTRMTKARYVYQKYHNIVLSKDDIVIFKDRNANNFDIDNLTVIKRQDATYYSAAQIDDFDLRMSNVLIGRIKQQLKNK